MSYPEVALIVATLLLSPFVLYLCVKLATYAWFKGRHQFQCDHPENKGEMNGKPQ